MLLSLHLSVSGQGLSHRLVFFVLVCGCAGEASELLPGGLSVLGAWTYVLTQDDLQHGAERLRQLVYEQLAAQNKVQFFPAIHVHM